MGQGLSNTPDHLNTRKAPPGESFAGSTFGADWPSLLHAKHNNLSKPNLADRVKMVQKLAVKQVIAQCAIGSLNFIDKQKDQVL